MSAGVPGQNAGRLSRPNGLLPWDRCGFVLSKKAHEQNVGNSHRFDSEEPHSVAYEGNNKVRTLTSVSSPMTVRRRYRGKRGSRHRVFATK